MKKVFVLLVAILICFPVFANEKTEEVTEGKSNLREAIQLDDTGKKLIGIVIEAPMTYVNNETARTIVPEKALSIFPKHQFVILPLDETSLAVRTYKEDNRMMDTEYSITPLNRSDIVQILKPLNCDYALFIKVSNSAPRAGVGMFSVSFKTSVTCDVRLLDINTGEYKISKQIVKDGKSTGFMGGIPSFDRAYNDALTKALDELKIDTSAL